MAHYWLGRGVISAWMQVVDRGLRSGDEQHKVDASYLS
jgi:hypothetical protein